MEDLRGLAERFVRLSSELEEVRAGMLAALTMNGAGEGRPFVLARTEPGQRATVVAARAAEAAIIERLRERPMGTAELARVTGSPVVTVQDRLRRLRARGAISGGGSSGWVATPAAG
jgi:hypothetical protein